MGSEAGKPTKRRLLRRLFRRGWDRLKGRIQALEAESQELRRRVAALEDLGRRAERLEPHVLTPAEKNLPADWSIEKERYESNLAVFNNYITQFDMPGLNKFFWYHAVDLDDGMVTPGDYDYRQSMDAFHFPDDMRGMKVLDIGSATGFFAFEFERRGADVYSVELPSLLDWDMIVGERDRILKGLMRDHDASSLEDATWRHLHGPFEFCHERRKSSVKRVLSTIYDLGPALFDGQTFDVVYLGDILLHLFSPLKALNVVAPLCKYKMIVAGDFADWGGIDAPLFRFAGLVNQKGDARSWWSISRCGLEQMLRRVGFRDVVDVGRYSGVHRRAWARYDRLVMHATK
jgi:SAM-dependent methyltransferase